MLPGNSEIVFQCIWTADFEEGYILGKVILCSMCYILLYEYIILFDEVENETWKVIDP